MTALLPYLALLAFLALAVACLARLAARVRRRGTAGGAVTAALAAYEEAYRVTSHEAYTEMRARADRLSPLESPDGHWRSGRTRRSRRRFSRARRVR
ncbi:hypothetical protein [Streptomyces sp. VRA16 Mangrove soil]|uniref:hypothetical protein n=1 Tax=Streptomyces sp. VRA16 Mangrove soil TaxID=2817434 RepID=UPI001A9EEA05|nr:hypothetical protein [Streptomyces sp. VRA16 Mangrove soil]MBO1332854.1 hypothetical protein [Streptomyces sp. VRA16 Mangrove soil]